jgi:hypothetical protein
MPLRACFKLQPEFIREIFATHPFWDPLRKDPRFDAFLKNPPPVRY